MVANVHGAILVAFGAHEDQIRADGRGRPVYGGRTTSRANGGGWMATLGG